MGYDLLTKKLYITSNSPISSNGKYKLPLDLQLISVLSCLCLSVIVSR
jgi:hypothetical protein